MAPEMVIMLTQSRHEKKGYSNAVDWWSLGATMFKLATGQRPFTEHSISQILNEELGLQKENKEMTEYAILFQDIPFPPDFDPKMKDIISKLLDVHADTRLGAGPNGSINVREHPFFGDIDWSLLEQKHLEPPFIPQTKALDDTPQYPSFETLMTSLGRSAWLTDVPDPKLQKYFGAW
jgi:serine/threonine protein kinase